MNEAGLGEEELSIIEKLKNKESTITTKEKLLTGDLNVNKGAIVENFVAQQLHAHGFEELYYYSI